MRIGIIGATGKAGSDIYREAVRRDHEVIALVQNRQKAAEKLGTAAEVLQRDAFELTADDLADFDVVVNAFGTSPDQAHQHVELTQLLVNSAGESKPRLVFILGAGSLTTGEDKHLFVDDIRQAPGAEAWISIPENQLKQLEYLRRVEEVDWVGVSPQAEFSPGEASTPVLGTDEIIFASDGTSHTTSGTMAVAILDEIENPQHVKTRFTVSDS
ncbi:NAD(P)H-binding protein [Brevibacterium daeguense]|uniref:NAD(P)H-binding protein n=1 Tax=Brevibacterium daeguense TaxID=909936 RepID=A0ABP8EF66_9MICO|nr:NAD(P)H-binding protein [Brevibacterium daeguense]